MLQRKRLAEEPATGETSPCQPAVVSDEGLRRAELVLMY